MYLEFTFIYLNCHLSKVYDYLMLFKFDVVIFTHIPLAGEGIH